MSAIERHNQAKQLYAARKAQAKFSGPEANQTSTGDTEQTPAKSATGAGVGKEYEVLRKLALSDYQRLKNMPDDGDKHRTEKAKLVNHYRDYLTAWMAAGERHNNDVLFFNIVWVADTGEWPYLFTLTDYAVQTGQTSEFFKSTPQSVAAREIYYASEREHEAGLPLPQAFSEAFTRVTSGVWAIPASVEARYYKLAGIVAQEAEDFDLARQYYEKSNSLDAKVGVKNLLKSLPADE